MIEKNQDGGVYLPENVQKNVHSFLVYDNIDRMEETLSGAGTTHRCNGIIVQPVNEEFTSEPNSNNTGEPISKKKCRRSLKIQEKDVEEYILGKGCGPDLRSINYENSFFAEEKIHIVDTYSYGGSHKPDYTKLDRI